jgi:hypothetical protein
LRAAKSKAQKTALARKNGASGGRARVKAIRARGGDQLRQDGLRLYRRQIEIYGAIFANRVNRNPEARREARRKGGLARQAQRKAQKEEAAKKLEPRQRDSATKPVIAFLHNGTVVVWDSQPSLQTSLASPMPRKVVR